MAQFQRKNPEVLEAILDKDGNAHVISAGVLTGEMILKATFEADWVPLVKQG
jgi:hypothetical protein